MRLIILPSPSASIALRHYQEEDRTAFHFLSDVLPRETPFLGKTNEPAGASPAVILENLSDKEITALCCCWSVRDSAGRTRTHMVTNDSYKVDVYHPVVLPRSKQLLCVSGRLDVDQSLYDHVLAGGGLMGSGGSA